MCCLQPLVPGLFRKALKDFELGGYTIKAGTPVSLNVLGATETDPAWADLPADSPFAVGKFNPDRWVAATSAEVPTWLRYEAQELLHMRDMPAGCL